MEIRFWYRNSTSQQMNCQKRFTAYSWSCSTWPTRIRNAHRMDWSLKIQTDNLHGYSPPPRKTHPSLPHAPLFHEGHVILPPGLVPYIQTYRHCHLRTPSSLFLLHHPVVRYTWYPTRIHSWRVINDKSIFPPVDDA